MESSHSISDIDGSVGIGGTNDTNTIVGPEETIYAYIYKKDTLGIKQEPRRPHTHCCRKHISLAKTQMKQLRIEEYDLKETQSGKEEMGI